MKTHILLVEDDTRLRECIATIMQQAGYYVTQAKDGETAITLLQEAVHAGMPYEVVISDIVMGQVDGIAVLQAAIEQPYFPEVILLTGKATIETAVQAVRQGAFDYLLKPCLVATIIERIEAACKRREYRLLRERAVAALQAIATVTSDTLTGSDAPSPAQALPNVELGFVQVGALCIDVRRHTVWFQDIPISLTPTEFAVLDCLAQTPEEAIPFTDITLHTHSMLFERAEARLILAPHIRNLRRKIDRRYIVSVPRIGYKLVNPEA